MWKRHPQQQQRGAQMHARENEPRQAGEAPDAATRDRDAQKHDRADLDVSGEALPPGDYPASPIENRGGRSTGPGAGKAPMADAEWDRVVEPEGAKAKKKGDWSWPESR